MALGTLAALGVGAALGGAKHLLVDQPKYEAKKKLAAETQRYSPWTGLRAEMPDQPSLFENAVGGAGYGLAAQAPVNDAISKYGLVDASGAGGAGGMMMPEMGSGFAPKQQFGLGGNFNFASNQQSPWMSLASKPTLYGSQFGG